jgi:hypothetical protein
LHSVQEDTFLLLADRETDVVLKTSAAKEERGKRSKDRQDKKIHINKYKKKVKEKRKE